MYSALLVAVQLIPIPSAEAHERSRRLQELLHTGALRHARAPVEEELQTEGTSHNQIEEDSE